MAKDDIAWSDEEMHGSTKQERSAERMAPLFEHYVSLIGGGEDERTNLADMLADWMHWAKENEVDFDAALSSAQMHYEHEHDDPDDELADLNDDENDEG